MSASVRSHWRRNAALALALLVLPMAAVALPGSPFAPAAPPAPTPPLVPTVPRTPSPAPDPTPVAPAAANERDRKVVDRAVRSFTKPVDVVLSDASLSPELLTAVEKLEGSKKTPKRKEGGFAGYRSDETPMDGLGGPGIKGSRRYNLEVPRGGGGVALLGVNVDGPLPRAEVERALKQRWSAVLYCYSRVLGHDPTLAGEATFALAVAHKGTVSVATAARTIAESVTTCVEDRYRLLEFSKRDAPSNITVTWRFSPE